MYLVHFKMNLITVVQCFPQETDRININPGGPRSIGNNLSNPGYKLAKYKRREFQVLSLNLWRILDACEGRPAYGKEYLACSLPEVDQFKNYFRRINPTLGASEIDQASNLYYPFFS
jgi:hypothetical protein